MVMGRLFGYAVFLSCVVGLQVDLPADPFKGYFVALGDVHKPRMLVMRGCSGSSSVMVFARNLLRYHGIPVPQAALPVVVNGVAKAPLGPGWPVELLNPKYNWFLSRAGGNIGKAMEVANAEMLRTNRTLFFKGMVHYMQGNGALNDQWASLKSSFEHLGMFAVIGTRVNVLDEVICQVRDCFQPLYGVPVDEDGKESELCFKRRGGTKSPVSAPLNSTQAALPTIATKIKAKLNAKLVRRFIDKEYDFITAARKNLNSIGIFPETVTEEDLLDFQTPMPGAFERAVAAWTVLLKSLGVKPNQNIIRDFLQRHRETFHDKPTHKDMIYNFGAVKAALNNTKYAHLIRE